MCFHIYCCDYIQVIFKQRYIIKSFVFVVGSIITTLRLVDTDVQAVVTVLPVLTRVLNAGTLKIHGTDGQQLKIPPQNITVVYQPAPKGNWSYLFILCHWNYISQLFLFIDE